MSRHRLLHVSRSARRFRNLILKRRNPRRRKLTKLRPLPLKIKAMAVSNRSKRHLTITQAVIRKGTATAEEMPAVKVAAVVVTINNTAAAVVVAENSAGGVAVENNFAAAVARVVGEEVVVAANGAIPNSKGTNIRNNRSRPRKSFTWATCPIRRVSRIWKRSPSSRKKSRLVARNRSG